MAMLNNQRVTLVFLVVNIGQPQISWKKALVSLQQMAILRDTPFWT